MGQRLLLITIAQQCLFVVFSLPSYSRSYGRDIQCLGRHRTGASCDAGYHRARSVHVLVKGSAKLLEQMRLITSTDTAIENIMQNSLHSLRTPEQQILIDVWFRDDGPPEKCKAELEELLRWLERQEETVGRNKSGSCFYGPLRRTRYKQR